MVRDQCGRNLFRLLQAQPLWRTAFPDVAKAVDWINANSTRFKGTITYPMVTEKEDEFVKEMSKMPTYDLNEEEKKEQQVYTTFGVSSRTDFYTMIEELRSRDIAVNVELKVTTGYFLDYILFKLKSHFVFSSHLLLDT